MGRRPFSEALLENALDAVRSSSSGSESSDSRNGKKFKRRHSRGIGRRVVAVATVGALGAGLAFFNRDTLHTGCVKMGLGFCAEGSFADLLQTNPQQLNIESSAQIKGINGQVVNNLGRYALQPGAAQKNKTDIVLLPTFTYDQAKFIQAFGSTYIDNNTKKQMTINDSYFKDTKGNPKNLIYVHTNFMTQGSASNASLQQECIDDMSAIVDDATNHANWFATGSVTATELLGSENVYSRDPFTKSITNNSNLVDIYVGYGVAGKDPKTGKAGIIINEIRCGVPEPKSSAGASK